MWMEGLGSFSRAWSFFLPTLLLLSLLCPSILSSEQPRQLQQDTGAWLNETTYNQSVGVNLFQTTFYTAPQVFKDNATGTWQTLKVTDRTASPSPHYLVQNAHMAARIGISTEWDVAGVLYYTPDLQRKICAEYWLVQAYISGSWQTLTTQFYSHSAVYNETFCNVTGVFRVYRLTTQVGWLRTSYILKPASFLKAEVAARSIAAQTFQFRLIKRLIGIAGTRVIHALGETTVTVNETQLTSRFLQFKNASDYTFLTERLEDLGHWENDTWINDYLKGMRLQLVEYEGRLLVRCDIAIGDWTLASGQGCYIDPTTSTYYVGTGTDDGYVYGSSTDYPTARTTATSSLDTITASFVGQLLYKTTYTVYRSFFKINTGSLPSYANILAANFSIYIATDLSTTDFTYRVRQWTGTTPITTADYTQYGGANYDDGTASSSKGTGWNNIVLSTFSIITKAGSTMIALLSSRDLSATAPTGQEYTQPYNYEGTYPPKLVVTWANPYPFYDHVGVTTHLANTTATFHTEWIDDYPTYNLSYWIFGSNLTGTFVNATAEPFYYDPYIVESSDTGGAAYYGSLYTAHPSSTTGRSSYGQGVLLNQPMTYNITGFSCKMKRTGSPNFNLTIGVYAATGSNPTSVPNRTWSNIANSTKINSTTISSSSLVWYNFTFSGGFKMASQTYYHFQVLVVNRVSGTLDNRVDVQFNDISGNPNPYDDGNAASYHSSQWNVVASEWDMEFRLYGLPAGTWSNVSATIPCPVGRVIRWQVWANSTADYWNTTGLQTFTVTGVNLTFYHSFGGYFYASHNSFTDFQEKTNGTTTGFCNGSSLSLLSATLNQSYYWLNFTWDGEGSTKNRYNLTITLALEDTELWCHFSLLPEPEQWIIARFFYNVSNPAPLDPILFDGSLSNSSDTIDTYSWDFGDLATDSGVTVTHNYTNTGVYLVVLNASGAAGWDTFEMNITVSEVGGFYLVARFTWNDSLPDLNEPILFNASSSASNEAITLYEWDFGDGSEDTGVTATHSYTAYGNFTVVLTVTSASGTNSTSQYLTVGSTPEWIAEMNLYPQVEIIILLAIGLLFTILFLVQRLVAWGAISFGTWLILGMVWILANPLSYFTALFFFGIAIVILILTLILQLAYSKGSKRQLGEESPV